MIVWDEKKNQRIAGHGGVLFSACCLATLLSVLEEFYGRRPKTVDFLVDTSQREWAEWDVKRAILEEVYTAVKYTTNTWNVKVTAFEKE